MGKEAEEKRSNLAQWPLLMIDSTNMLGTDGVSGTVLGTTEVTSGSQSLRPAGAPKGALEGEEQF